MSIGVQDLIDNWEQVRNLVRASHRGSELSSLASLTDEKETWEVFAALIGYSQETREDLATILSQIPDDIPVNDAAWYAAPFLRYAGRFNISRLDQFLPAVYSVKRKLGRVPILESSEVQLERCLRNAKTVEDFLKCISGQEQEQKPKAYEAGAGDEY